jgi:hydrogenase nickel incorporation protein HypA/HybF
MHELTIAREIVRLVRENLTPRQVPRLKCINLLIGRITAVQEDCLFFSLEAITKDTPFSGVEVRIEYIEPLFRCRACGEESESGDWFYSPCPKCGSFDRDLLKGDELSVASVDLE